MSSATKHDQYVEVVRNLAMTVTLTALLLSIALLLLHPTAQLLIQALRTFILSQMNALDRLLLYSVIPLSLDRNTFLSFN